MFKRILPTVCIFLIGSISSYCQYTRNQNELVKPVDSLKLLKQINYIESLSRKNSEEALDFYNLIEKDCEKLNYVSGIGEVLLNKGKLEYFTGEYDSGIIDSKKAISYFNKISNASKILQCYLTIGKSFFYSGNLDSAMYYLLLGVKRFEGYSDKGLASLYNMIGKIMYNTDNDINKIIPYHLKAIEISTKFKDTSELIIGYTFLASNYLELKQFEKALDCNAANIKISKGNVSSRDYSLIYNLSSYILLKTNKPDSAIKFALLATKYGMLSGDVNLYMLALINLERCYNGINDQGERLKTLNKTLEKLSHFKNRFIYKEYIYSELADVNFKTKHYKEAYENVKEYFHEGAVEQVIKTGLRITELEAKYQAAQRDKSIIEQRLQLAKKDIQLQKNRNYLYLSFAVFALIILLTVNLYFKQINKRKNHERQLEILIKEKEIEALQALMKGEEKERARIAKELHDGVAGLLVVAKMHLNRIKTCEQMGYANNELSNVIELIDEAYIDIRKTSHNLMPEVLVKYGLDEALRRYCHNISISNKLIIEYDSWGDFKRYKNSFELSIYRIVQELIANIIKHSQATKAIVQMSIHDNILSIDIEDNGVGFQHKQELDGMGLHSLQSKVKAIDGKLEMESDTNKGVRAYLEFDLFHMQVSTP